ncbi:PREDICTED: serine protease nudel-like isoform X2 [Nicrophorus vespilloides]|uniref:Serine protease nudel-like isoform X2 n=1 Tax=Nicrophorus vespilloides TaxID=110193 RepID=A0ABM1N2N2_NICVS|nr:PREDICTED: serine protease nudel-like isoform X2 [Nicrophorus vespilloides]
METFCTTSRHPKYRPSLNSSSYYQASTYGRNYRQSDYSFANSTRNSALLWHERAHLNAKKSRGKICSIALATAAFLVLVTVLAIAGLALYMGAFRNEPTNASVSFSCSAKVSKGDRFVTGLQDKARKYRQQLEFLYQRSTLGPALVSCTIERFGNDSQTIFFKITLNRMKIPRHFTNVEKALKDILLSDAVSRKPIFRTVRFDPRSINIRQSAESEAYQRVITKPKELPKVRPPVVLHKPTAKPNLTVTADLPVKKRPIVEEIDIKEDNLPVIQGSFKISKTEADITEKKSIPTTFETTHKPKTTSSQKVPTLKETAVTSAPFKLATAEKSPKPSSTTTTTTATTTSTAKTITSTTSTTTTTEKTTTTERTTTVPEFKYLSTNLPSNKFIFSISPDVYNQEPWVPIYENKEASETPQTFNRPIYTSFTNPGLSFNPVETEKLGSTNLQGHPIPVNKIPTITEPFFFETTTDLAQERNEDMDLYDLKTSDSNFDEGFVEVETLKYVPGSANTTTIDTDEKSNWEIVNSTTPNSSDAYKLKQTAILKNISSIFHSLVSTLSLTTKPTVEEKEPDRVGQVEVVDVDDLSLIMQTTKLPLVTLLPVKSNSGVGRPVRPRPKNENKTLIENRSFSNDPPKVNLNAFIETPIFTEVVTSVSSESSKVKLNKTQLAEFKVGSDLNFATEVEQETTTEEYSFEDDVAILSINSSGAIESEVEGVHYITPEKLKKLSEISKLSNNHTLPDDGVISTKAISSSYTINHSGFNLLTKTFNKIPNSVKEEEKKASTGYNSFHLSLSNRSECSNFTYKCDDGQCLPVTARCNQLVDCNDGSDEKNCNCADYLRSQFLLRKICDGIVDCWDYSDENQCEWCLPNQYVCGNSKVCINRTSICDGIRDCPHGDDERQCVTVAPSLNAADEFPYHSEGYLMVRKHGQWGKWCVDNFQNVVAKSQTAWEIRDLGQAVCKAMTYQSLDNVKILKENKSKAIYRNSKYYELSYTFQNETKSSLTFESTGCKSGEVVKVKCQSLQCGARPQAAKQAARIVGGGNAGLGAWPWQAALYKEGEFKCGATLISDKWLLSAGHCFYQSLDEHWVARLGALRRGTALPSPYEQLRPIIQIILHPDYVDAGFINDISLLKMEVGVIFSDYVRPICLPSAESPPNDGRMCTVIGWGQLFEIGKIFPDTLQEVQVPVISTEKCRERTLFMPLFSLTEDMFCAGYDRGGRDACLGDSGGPLMCPESDGRWVLHGITSNGYGCARPYHPGVYTKVSNYISWIDSHLSGAYNSNGTVIKSACSGHRCPLGECLSKSRLCNGFIECSDGSDEVGCLDN